MRIRFIPCIAAVCTVEAGILARDVALDLL